MAAKKSTARKSKQKFHDPVKINDEPDDFAEDNDFVPVDPEDDASEFELLEMATPEATSELLELHANVERALFAVEAPEAGTFAAAEAFQGANAVVGIGIGSAEVDFDQCSPEGPGTPVLNVYVAEPMDIDTARACVVDGLGVRALVSDNVPVNVINTGLIETLPHTHRERASPNGISAGHKDITAGTQGALARGRSGDRSKHVLMLSNNHVLANVNAGKKGDPILQPGPLDNGRNPKDRVAVLERFVKVHFDDTPNYVDCATGWAWSKRVRKDYVYRSGNQWKHFSVSDQTRSCQTGLHVGKSGRTTQLTVGRITDCNASIRVSFGQGRVANYKDQIAIKGLKGNFSAPGDSGSLIWTWDSKRNPVGLLFAGGGGVTFANKIDRVLKALDIRLLT